MKLAGFVILIKDSINMFCFEFKNHRRRRTATTKKTTKKFEYYTLYSAFVLLPEVSKIPPSNVVKRYNFLYAKPKIAM
jgi:hypothetical protein